MNEAQITSACEQVAAVARDAGPKIEVSVSEASFLVQLADVGLCTVVREFMRMEGRTPTTPETAVDVLREEIEGAAGVVPPAIARRGFSIAASGVIEAVSDRVKAAQAGGAR